MQHLGKCDSMEHHAMTLFRLQAMPKAIQQLYQKEVKVSPRERFLCSSDLLCKVSLISISLFFLFFSIFPQKFVSFRNPFHSLLYSMMLLASGALYSNLFHMLLILCVKEFCFLLFFPLVSNFLIFRSFLLTSLVLKHKEFAWINFINPSYNFKNFS